ncbi:wax ester/triacylglycerol synthase family O-acyltransferase [Gordonia sp. ABSL1-1]|uniref:wax ester/triacylglycerol synthase domain-containing protein n=1 Tax=Gordonia sp. ABSL1-1 TaxID=3053923 RepID=UPI00257240D5|nr:wax ester/triacylglycerol synthase domain-containing protein [Gordonia sp. ABSL1-1]MDL9937846.1 wax ester/triacylglycerol synthase family O-acyltransferase [Gordonia sp. ABSL1-1]
MTGPDALMLNMESASTPMHTLKVAVLDPSRRGEPVTLAELRAVLPNYLGRFPRATQRLEYLAGYAARPFWVRDEYFDVADHLDEVTLSSPGGRTELDALLAELAVARLDRDRPLWALTLVHGLAQGQQAVVVRVHHALADGLAALNTFMASTGERGEVIVPAPPAPVGVVHDQRTLWKAARAESWQLLCDIPRVVTGFGRALEAKRSARRAGAHIPKPMTVRRNSFNARSGAQRVCASGDIPLADIQRIALATGTSVNGALHGVIAGAKRAELLGRGEDPGMSVTVFGVCRDLTSTRTFGNEIATAAAYLRTDLDDPVARIVQTAASCDATVRRRRAIGFELTEKIATYTGRVGPVFRSLAAHRAPLVMNNITTANMPGPRTTRWVGDIEIVDWISFALAIAPADVNLTAYSYAGRISFGLIATPESMPDPAGFIRRIKTSLAQATDALDLHAATVTSTTTAEC